MIEREERRTRELEALWAASEETKQAERVRLREARTRAARRPWPKSGPWAENYG